MSTTPIKGALQSALTITIIIYGSTHLLGELFRTIVPVGMILTVLMFAAVYFLRIPAPRAEAVEAIVGKDPYADPNDDSYVLKTVSHRGCGLDAPENSLAAFNLCKEKGCTAVELDVTLTSDDVPIIFHDSTLERMTDLNLVVNDTKWADLSHIDIAVKHPFRDRFAKTHIPTLDQAVSQLLANDQRMILDLKQPNTKFVKIILDLYEKYPLLYSRCVVSSFFPTVIYLIRRGDPKIVCSMAWRPNFFANESYNYPQGKGGKRYHNLFRHYMWVIIDFIHEWALERVISYLLGLSIILLHKDVICGRTIFEWRQREVRVMAYSINTPVDKQYYARTLKITYLTDTLTGETTTHTPPV